MASSFSSMPSDSFHALGTRQEALAILFFVFLTTPFVLAGFCFLGITCYRILRNYAERCATACRLNPLWLPRFLLWGGLVWGGYVSSSWWIPWIVQGVHYLQELIAQARCCH